MPNGNGHSEYHKMWGITWLAEARPASQEVLGVSSHNYTYLLHTRTAVKPPAIAKPTAPFNKNDISFAVRSKKQTLQHSGTLIVLFPCQFGRWLTITCQYISSLQHWYHSRHNCNLRLTVPLIRTSQRTADWNLERCITELLQSKAGPINCMGS